jgi:hypothetical protein
MAQWKIKHSPCGFGFWVSGWHAYVLALGLALGLALVCGVGLWRIGHGSCFDFGFAKGRGGHVKCGVSHVLLT